MERRLGRLPDRKCPAIPSLTDAREFERASFGIARELRRGPRFQAIPMTRARNRASTYSEAFGMRVEIPQTPRHPY
jgi:hypothetical protein